jgi:hypothetical protein
METTDVKMVGFGCDLDQMDRRWTGGWCMGGIWGYCAGDLARWCGSEPREVDDGLMGL